MCENVFLCYTSISKYVSFLLVDQKITSTPLLEYLANVRQARRDERKRKSEDKKQQREEEKQRKNQMAKSMQKTIEEEVEVIPRNDAFFICFSRENSI